MTLTQRIVLLFGLLLAVMLALAGWGSQWLARQLSAGLDEVAVGVGESVISVLDEEAMSRGEAERGPVVVVERIISAENQTIRATHRQAGDAITNLSVQVDEQPVQVIEIPRQLLHDGELEGLRLEAAARSLRDGELRLIGARVQREIPVSRTGVADALDRYSRHVLIGLALLFGFGLLGAVLIARRVGRPLSKLQDAARQMGQGALGLQVAERSSVSEVDETIGAFNRMSSQLESLEESRQQLQARSQLAELGEIGRGLAHSLRNPLNTIGLAIDQLAAGRDDPAAQRLAAQARDQIQRIDRSIRGFLTLASASQAMAEPVNLVATVRDVMLEALQRHPGSHIEVEAPETVTLEAVGTEVRAILQSLMVNALESGSEPQTVTVRLSPREDGSVHIEVADRGEGVPATVAERLFQPHVTSKADGSGMGLYLTRRLAESHYNGSVALSPRDGGGTVARLTLKPRVARD